MVKHMSGTTESPSTRSWFSRLGELLPKRQRTPNNGDRRIRRSSAFMVACAFVLTAFALTFAYSMAWAKQMERLESMMSVDAFAEFDLKTLDGEHFTNENLKDAKLTLINVWSTDCAPCVMEMPDLEELSHSYPGEVQVVGICKDTADTKGEPDQSKITEAHKIVEKTGVTFPSLVPDEQMYAFLASSIAGTPTTFYVDQNGKIVASFSGRENLEKIKEHVEAELFKLS